MLCTIHLGDTYYAGTNPEETSKLLAYWAKGSKASFALNSNQEMYSGGGPYFDTAIGNPVFNKLQSPWSFFALENTDWILCGLDSPTSPRPLRCSSGTLGTNNNQTQFLEQVAARKKKTILFTPTTTQSQSAASMCTLGHRIQIRCCAKADQQTGKVFLRVRQGLMGIRSEERFGKDIQNLNRSGRAEGLLHDC